jgi:hypothetical protein
MFKAEHLATSIARLCCFGPFSINYYAAYVYPLTDTIPLPCVLSHCSAYRTPICKAKRGGFKDTYPEDLLTVVLKVWFCYLVSLLVFATTGTGWPCLNIRVFITVGWLCLNRSFHVLIVHVLLLLFPTCRLFWTTLKSIQVTLVTLWLGRC